MMEGFDVSGWSGDVDFAGAKAAGKQFCYLRVGRGKPDGATDSSGIDLKWAANRWNAVGTGGIYVGGYWRFFPDVDMRMQVDRFVGALNQRNGMLPPLMDIEDTGGLSPADLTNWAIDCAKMIWARSGRRPVLYTGKNFYDSKLEYWRLDFLELCIAWQINGNWKEYGSIFWQYLLDINVPWSTGRVDLMKFGLEDIFCQLFQNELIYQFDAEGVLHGPLVYSDKLLPEAGRQGTQPNYIAIVHTMVGYLNGTDASFRGAGNVLESTFGVGGKYDGIDLDGAIYQWMLVDDIADANYHANDYAMSIETSDGTKYLERWTPKQAESIAQILAAWCRRYDRPARLVKRAHPSERGIGHHRQGTDPWRGSGDDYWSPEGNRACPGVTRINQLVDEVIPRVQQILNSLNPLNPPPPVEESDVQLDEVVGKNPDGSDYTVRDVLAADYNLTRRLLEVATEIRDKLDEVSTVDDVKEQANELTNVLYLNNGQAKWSGLQNKTWAAIHASKRPWGRQR